MPGSATSLVNGSGRVALITGASRGIGRQMALDLGAAGFSVVVAARSLRSRERLPGSIGETAAAVTAAGGQALAHACDVRDETQIAALVDACMARFGRLDAVVHNAGALWWRPALETPAKRLDLVLAVNLRAAFLLATLAAPHMTGGGHVVFMAPPLDQAPHPGMAAYTASKFGMTHAALALAEEWRPLGLAVNTLWPATLIESQATINWKLGTRADWRKPTVVSHALLALLGRDPSACTGRQLLDEEILAECGVRDLSVYRCDPAHEPARVDYAGLADVLRRLGPGTAG